MANKEKLINCLNRVSSDIEGGKKVDVDDLNFIKENIFLLEEGNKKMLREFFDNMLMQDDIGGALDFLNKSGILFIVIPELESLKELQQPSKYHDYDAFFHTMKAVEFSEKDLILRLTMLLHDIGKPESYNKDETGKITFYGHGIVGERKAFKILSRLNYDKKIIKDVCLYIRHHMDYAPTEKSFNKMLKELGNDINKVENLLKIKLYDVYASKGENHELADNARNNDNEYRKIMSKYKR